VSFLQLITAATLTAASVMGAQIVGGSTIKQVSPDGFSDDTTLIGGPFSVTLSDGFTSLTLWAQTDFSAEAIIACWASILMAALPVYRHFSA